MNIEMCNFDKKDGVSSCCKNDKFGLWKHCHDCDTSPEKKKCENAKTAQKEKEICITKIKGDGFCHDENNNAYCEWDGGDCCISTNKLRIKFMNSDNQEGWKFYCKVCHAKKYITYCQCYNRMLCLWS